MASDRLPNPNRYITGNNADGDSFFSDDLPPSTEAGYNLGGGIQRLAYQTRKTPISLSDNNDLEHYKSNLQSDFQLVPADGGTKIWYNDIPPGGGSTMHRSVSFDVIIQVTGEVELTLSNGETRTIRPGDMVVQRSTLHKWHNPSNTQWARMVAFVSDCQPYVTEKGTVLGDHFPST